MRRTRNTLTQWLAAWRHGDEHARDQLFAAVYPQLRQIASRFLQHERGDHTLEPTALVNELALRLRRLRSEPHFFGRIR